MEKGIETREKILHAAMHMVRESGFENLSIGETAKQVGMSKSGVFAHFESRDELLLKVIDFTVQDFKTHVFDRAMQYPRGLQRIHALSKSWIKWSNQPSGGCPFMSGAFEFDDKPGVIRDALVKQEKAVQEVWERAAKIAIEEKEFRQDADCKQFAYEVFGNLLSFQINTRRMTLLHPAEIIFPYYMYQEKFMCRKLTARVNTPQVDRVIYFHTLLLK